MKKNYFLIFFFVLILNMPLILIRGQNIIIEPSTVEELKEELELIKKENPLIYYYYEVEGSTIAKPYHLEKPNLSYLHNPAYGEDNQLDQFTDNFVNETWVMVKEVVIRNSTLDCMELNYTSLVSFTTSLYQMREHDVYASYEPAITFSYDAGQSSAETYSTDPALGDGYNFFSINSNYAEGKYIRFRWKFDSDYILYKNLYFRVYDGTYDRTNSTHFPDDNPIINFGAGQLYNYRITSGDNSWQTYDLELTLDSWGHTESNVTLFWLNHDYNNQYRSYMYIDWIEINSASGGSGNLFKIDFDATTNRVNEVTGTDEDYGYMNNTGLPWQSGGYLQDGYFITEDYLNFTLGSTLVLLTNSSIPTGTAMTVQFSEDNSTWMNSEGSSGYNTITDGFLAIDLRNLNYTDSYIMYNFTGSDKNTSRLYQSRLITTGNVSIGSGSTIINVYGINSSTILMLIFLCCLGLLIYIGVKKR